jgi:hypothetical protein
MPDENFSTEILTKEVLSAIGVTATSFGFRRHNHAAWLADRTKSQGEA